MCYQLRRFNNLVIITILILTSDSQLNMSTTPQLVNNLIGKGELNGHNQCLKMANHQFDKAFFALEASG